MANSRWLLDTNILLRLSNWETLEHQQMQKSVDWLWSKGAELLYTSQSLSEFWNVCTRPVERNGFGLPIDETERRTATIESQLRFAPDSEAVHRIWRTLVFEHQVRGAKVHDARLVAAMRAHGIDNLLTLNDQDFRRYRDIAVFSPYGLGH